MIPPRIFHRSILLACVAVLSLLSLLAVFTPVAGSGGSVQLSVQGYGAVPGQLQNSIIEPNNTVSMTMLVNDQMQSSIGPIQLTSVGEWVGVRNGAVLSGQVQDWTGKVQACVPICLSANFNGQGNWNGQLDASSSQGMGTFTGTITFASSSIPQITVGQSYPISGTWNADFATPMPEFQSESLVYVIVLAIMVLVKATTHFLQKPWNKSGEQQTSKL